MIDIIGRFKSLKEINYILDFENYLYAKSSELSLDLIQLCELFHKFNILDAQNRNLILASQGSKRAIKIGRRARLRPNKVGCYRYCFHEIRGQKRAKYQNLDQK